MLFAFLLDLRNAIISFNHIIPEYVKILKKVKKIIGNLYKLTQLLSAF